MMFGNVTLTLLILIVSIGGVGFYSSRGVGNMGQSLRQLGLFLLDKAPAGIVDLFDKSAGRGARNWMMLGGLWFCVAGTLGFLGFAKWRVCSPPLPSARGGGARIRALQWLPWRGFTTICACYSPAWAHLTACSVRGWCSSSVSKKFSRQLQGWCVAKVTHMILGATLRLSLIHI